MGKYPLKWGPMVYVMKIYLGLVFIKPEKYDSSRNLILQNLPDKSGFVAPRERAWASAASCVSVVEILVCVSHVALPPLSLSGSADNLASARSLLPTQPANIGLHGLNSSHRHPLPHQFTELIALITHICQKIGFRNVVVRIKELFFIGEKILYCIHFGISWKYEYFLKFI